MLRPALALSLALALPACGQIPFAPGGDSAGTLEDRVWVDTGDDVPRGTLRAFLSNGTLVMTSCSETYRLAPWRWVEGSTLVWDEDGAFIRARVAYPGRDEMTLVMDLGGEIVSRTYRLTRAPAVCPDRR